MFRYAICPLLLALVSACGQREDCRLPAGLQNPVTDSTFYKRQLLKELTKLNHPHYYLEQYAEDGAGTYMLVVVQQENVCMTVRMEIRNTPGLDGIIRHKGGGYRGAELVGLQYTYDNDANLVCRKVEAVLD